MECNLLQDSTTVDNPILAEAYILCVDHPFTWDYKLCRRGLERNFTSAKGGDLDLPIQRWSVLV